MKLTAFRNLAHSRAAPTDPLDVQSHLTGLEEKFRIYNNDGLADALGERLNELLKTSRQSVPETLSFLLHLSDRPAQNSRIEDLDLLRPKSQSTSLTWSEILAQDPLDNSQGIWDNIDYVGDSDDGQSPPLAASAKSSLDSSLESENLNLKFEQLLLPLSLPISQSNIGNGHDKPIDEPQLEHQPFGQSVSEAEVIRVVLFMLHGLPTTTFVQIDDGGLLFSRECRLCHTADESFTRLLSMFAQLGSKITMIRRWIERPTSVPLLQSMRAIVSQRIQDFDHNLTNLEAAYFSPCTTRIASLLDLSWSIEAGGRTIQQVSGVIEQSDAITGVDRPFAILELLYTSICISQAVGDPEVYHFMTSIFLDGMEAYLRSVRSWMESADLFEPNHEFFVERNPRHVPRESLWTEQYRMIRLRNGEPYAPKCIHPAAKKIFNTGKSIAFLKALGHTTATQYVTWRNDRLDIERSMSEVDNRTLTPFPELFSSALTHWVEKRHNAISIALRQQLEDHCGMHDTLNSLEYLYFQRDGARSVNAMRLILDSIDRKEDAWPNDVILTQLFREAFKPHLGINSQRITARFLLGLKDLNVQRRSVRIFESFHLSFSVPWAVANIVQPNTVSCYQRISILLLQTQRIIHTLATQRFGQAVRQVQSANSELYFALSLRHRLLWFANSVLSYLTELVLATNTAKFRKDLANANDIDDMVRVHEAYIARLERQCLLSKQLEPIRRAVISLFDLGMSFAEAHFTHQGRKPLEVVFQSADLVRDRQIVQQKSQEIASPSSLNEQSDDNANERYGTQGPTSPKTTYVYRLKKMHETFARLHSFIVAGLRGVHRAGAEPCWEYLADLLAMGFSARGPQTT